MHAKSAYIRNQIGSPGIGHHPEILHAAASLIGTTTRAFDNDKDTCDLLTRVSVHNYAIESGAAVGAGTPPRIIAGWLHILWLARSDH